MEKGFNDQELADIMSEIENLEREFADESPAPKAAPVEAEHAHTDSPVLKELAHKPVEETVHKTNHHAEKVVPMKSKKSSDASAPASLTFQVSGQMSVNLGFEVNGQSVALSVSEEGLTIEMESGAKFTLPLDKAHAAKKAA